MRSSVISRIPRLPRCHGCARTVRPAIIRRILSSRPQNYLAELVNAAMNSPYWPGLAIFVTWDDWGGFYDHVVPPVIDALGTGRGSHYW